LERDGDRQTNTRIYIYWRKETDTDTNITNRQKQSNQMREVAPNFAVPHAHLRDNHIEQVAATRVVLHEHNCLLLGFKTKKRDKIKVIRPKSVRFVLSINMHEFSKKNSGGGEFKHVFFCEKNPHHHTQEKKNSERPT
jgi:hypothetical protein